MCLWSLTYITLTHSLTHSLTHTGLLRSARFTIGSFQRRIIQPIINAAFTYDVLLHTYSFNGTLNFPRNNELIDSKLVNFRDWELYTPNNLTYIFVEDQDEFDKTINITDYARHGDYWSNNYVSLKNHIRALHSLQHLANIVESRNTLYSKHHRDMKYDYIIYLRPDVYFTNDLPVQLISLFPDQMLLPDFHRSCFGSEYNDRFAMGTTTSALIYGNRINYLLNYSNHKTVQSESYLFDYLQMFNISVLEIPFRFQRIRFSGSIHARDITIITVYEQQQETQHQLPSFLRFIIRNRADSHSIYCAPNDKITLSDLRQCTSYFTSHHTSANDTLVSALDMLYQPNVTYKQRIENSKVYNRRQSCATNNSNLRGTATNHINDDFYLNICDK